MTILTRPMKTLTIASRFCGPAASSNGGYFAGLVATLASRTLAVRLLKPPPLDTELAVRNLEDGTLQVVHADEVIGEARPAVLTLDAKPPPDYLEAVEASRRYAGFRYQRFPSCFVCGTRRVRGDGLRIFAGLLPERALVAAPWVPDASLDQGDGKVRPEFMSAALDCPGYYAVAADDRMMLLAELTAHVDRRVHVGESCTVVALPIAPDRPKDEGGHALFGG